jgi:hypothetical protein
MSNSNIRVVKYSEDLFKVPSRTQKRKKPDKPIKLKSEKKVSNKSIRNTVLKEIRKNQENKYNSLLDEPRISSLSNDFENDFKNSVDFMKKIADEHKSNKINQTIKNHNASVVERPFAPVQDTNLIPVIESFNQHYLEQPFTESFNQQPFNQPVTESYGESFNQPFTESYGESFNQSEPIKILPTPSYGCLKNGALPTYRSYHNKTIKAGTSQQQQPQQQQPQQQQPQQQQQQEHPSLITERMKSPTELLLIEKLKQREIEQKTKNQVVKQKKYKKLLRRTYRVGRDRFRPKVGVLLPNKTIRSNVTTKSYMLKQTPIDEIRKTLIKQGFIKVGSNAPTDILRKIYESIKMIDGDIKNHNPDNLLYNFFNEKK